MTAADMAVLLPALEAATGEEWDSAHGLLWRHADNWLTRVQVLRRPRAVGAAERLVTLAVGRSRLDRTVGPGRGWPQRAAAAIVTMMEAR